MLIKITPQELFALAAAAGFYFPDAIVGVGATDDAMHLEVSARGALPNLPSFLRGFIPDHAVTVTLRPLDFSHGKARFQTEISGGAQLTNLLTPLAGGLINDLLTGNDLDPRAIELDQQGVLTINTQALLPDLVDALAITKLNVQSGELVVAGHLSN